MNTASNARLNHDVRPRTAALVAGIGLLVMAVIGGAANFGVIANLTVPGDAGATAANLIASAGGLRLAGAGLVIVAILDVVVAWGLYIVLRGVNPGLSLLAAWFRVAYAAAFAAAINALFDALHAAPINSTLAMFSVQSYDQAWQLALVVFGVHLGLVGFLVWKAEFAHWIFGALLILSGAGYIVDGLGTILTPNYALGLSAYTFIGEVLFIFWLLVRGPRLPETSG
ncbi:MAG: DUF4386 domain-containing protein [Anaerolineales bacterium]